MAGELHLQVFNSIGGFSMLFIGFFIQYFSANNMASTSLFKAEAILPFLMTVFYLNKSHGADLRSAYPSLSMHGETYRNACEADLKNMLLTTIQARYREVAREFTVMKAILCAPKSKANKAYIKSKMSNSIRVGADATAIESTLKIVRVDDELIDDMMAEAHAWGVSVRMRDGNFSLQYFENEACVKEVVFKKRKSKWVIYEVGQACD